MQPYTTIPVLWMLLLCSTLAACSSPDDECVDCADGALDATELTTDDTSTDGALDDETSADVAVDDDNADEDVHVATDVAADEGANDASDTDTADAADDAPDGDPVETDGSPDADADASDVGDVDVAEGPWMRIGTGYAPGTPGDGFRPIVAGEALIMTEGPQGGVHVWGGFEGSGLPRRVVDAVFTLTAEDSSEIGSSIITADMVDFGDHVATAGHPVFIGIEFDWEELEGPTYELCVEVPLSDGTTLTDCEFVTTDCCLYLD